MASILYFSGWGGPIGAQVARGGGSRRRRRQRRRSVAANSAGSETQLSELSEDRGVLVECGVCAGTCGTAYWIDPDRIDIGSDPDRSR